MRWGAALVHIVLVSIWVALFGVAPGSSAPPIDYDFSGRLSLEGRWHPQSGAFPEQSRHASGVLAEPEFHLEDARGRSFSLTPFFRYDSADPLRTHADLREAYLLVFGQTGSGEWELRLGVDRVFWGVAESRHLVDIVNQTDLIEHPDEEEKLGQPMAHLTWSADWGVVEVFGLPYHRGRTFPGPGGRLRYSLVVDDDNPLYESRANQWHFDVAARYSHSLGPLDIGASVFDGTSREPHLQPELNSGGVPFLRPYYGQIRQLGLDAQLTLDAWLLKLEAIQRSGARNIRGVEQNYGALVSGFEYTFYSVWGSAHDLSLLGEWNYDGRGGNATNAFDNDVFVATRWAPNDVQGTELLAGIMFDATRSSQVVSLEFNRRITDRWSLSVESIAFPRVEESDILHETRRDSFFSFSLIYNF